jgi:hypothetical protein
MSARFRAVGSSPFSEAVIGKTGPALLPDPKTATPVNRMLAKKLGGCIPKFRIFWESGPGPKYRVSSLDAAQYRWEALSSTLLYPLLTEAPEQRGEKLVKCWVHGIAFDTHLKQKMDAESL